MRLFGLSYHVGQELAHVYISTHHESREGLLRERIALDFRELKTVQERVKSLAKCLSSVKI